MNGCKDQKGRSINVLEHVVCRVSLKHSPRGSLHLVLVSPLGTRSSILLPRPKDRTDKPFENWPFLSVHFWGEPGNGTWTLEAQQTSQGRRSGVLISWQLILYGTADSAPSLGVPKPKKDPEKEMMDEVMNEEDLLNPVLEENELQVGVACGEKKLLFLGKHGVRDLK